MLVALTLTCKILAFLYAHRKEIDAAIVYAEEALAGTQKGMKLSYVLGRIHAAFAAEQAFENSPFEPIAPYVLGHIDARVAKLFPKGAAPSLTNPAPGAAK